MKNRIDMIDQKAAEIVNALQAYADHQWFWCDAVISILTETHTTEKLIPFWFWSWKRAKQVYLFSRVRIKSIDDFRKARMWLLENQKNLHKGPMEVYYAER